MVHRAWLLGPFILPNSSSGLVHACRAVLGLSLSVTLLVLVCSVVAIWAKAAAHKIIGDYAWYWFVEESEIYPMRETKESLGRGGESISEKVSPRQRDTGVQKEKVGRTERLSRRAGDRVILSMSLRPISFSLLTHHCLLAVQGRLFLPAGCGTRV